MIRRLRVKRALRRAEKLISDPDRWTRSASARNEAGEAVVFYAPDAVKWCAYGAIAKCGPGLVGLCMIATDKAAQRLGFVGAAAANDDGGHAIAREVLRNARRLV